MSQMVNGRLKTVSAWPSLALYNRVGGTVHGFLMPRVGKNFKEIHQLYGTTSRKQNFPDSDWQFIVRTARNLASAVNIMHQSGIIVGDLNEKNILISTDDTQVVFLDADSFQITGNGSFFPCVVGVSHYTAPELQGKSFSNVTRTLNHDNFGLSVLLFRLLFFWRDTHSLVCI